MIRLEQVDKVFLTKRAGSFKALEKLSFEIERGSFTAIVGPSGCGKSTLLNLISGIDKPTAGSVYLNGGLVTGIAKNIGYVFQEDLLLPWKTVDENVRLALTLRRRQDKEADELVRTWISRVGLEGFARHYPRQLSGGMRKRVALAQALVYQPEVLLMDEPFSALDVQTRNLMEDELLQIWAQERSTVVFVTHDLEEAIALADRVLVLTAPPGHIRAAYATNLPRDRNVNEVRFDPHFRELLEAIWHDLREEVLKQYAKERVANN